MKLGSQKRSGPKVRRLGCGRRRGQVCGSSRLGRRLHHCGPASPDVSAEPLSGTAPVGFVPHPSLLGLGASCPEPANSFAIPYWSFQC